MPMKKLAFPIFGFLILLTGSIKPVATANQIDRLKTEGTAFVRRMANTLDELEDTDDPNEIFTRALDEYSAEFDSYLDITGLNVYDKEDITLPDFDINYVAPDYATIMNDYETNFQARMTPAEKLKYNNFRLKNVYFDKHITLIETKYVNLNVRPKFNPDLDIHFPLIEHSRSASLATILATAGLAEGVISAFAGCATALSSAISTSWIPFIGWVLAVGIAVGALIALTAIIVEYWDAISQVIEDIKAWFLQEFVAFASFIISFFGDAVAKGNESRVAGRDKIGDRDITWISKVVRTGESVTYLEDLRRNNELAILMRNVKKYPDELDNKTLYMSYWQFETPVPIDFVMDYNLYDLGISTYTWYNNTARRLMMNGTALLESTTYNSLGEPYQIGYHKFQEKEKKVLNGFNHYHVFEYQDVNGVFQYERITTNPHRKAHSFFGLMYFRWPGSNEPETFPKNP
ncbi:MAG: hypothetical protein ACI32C_03860 [Candidatus Enteromonas sp.]